MNLHRWLGVMAMSAMTLGLGAQEAEPKLPRPGSVVASQVIGDVKVIAGDQTKQIKADERIRVGVTITTGRRSLAVLELSNGTTLRLGSESELELEEFGQQPLPSSVKLNEIKEEPTISRTRLRLVKGDLGADVKKLKTPRGSSFLMAFTAGTLRISEGTFHAMVRMTDIGLGVSTLDFPSGVAEFEPVGGAFAAVRAGTRLGFAIETDKLNGTVKLSALPNPGDAPKREEIVTPTPAPKAEEKKSEATATQEAPPTKDLPPAKKK